MADDKPAPGTGRNYPDPEPQTKSEPKIDETSSTQISEEIPESAAEDTVTLPKSVVDDILSRLRAVEDSGEAPRFAKADEVHLGETGEQIGLKTKWSIDPKDYFDPTEDLANEEKFQRVGFKENFILSWKVSPVQYKTAFGATYREPRFEVVLYQRLFDEYGDPVMKDEQAQLILRKRGYFFNDQADVERVAADMGLEHVTPELFNEVRYERIKRFLETIFWPNKPAKVGQGAVETVIDGQVVQLISAEDIAIEGDPNFKTKIENYKPKVA